MVTRIDQSWSFELLEEHIVGLYPGIPLSLVGFQYARCLKGAQRMLQVLKPNSIRDLKVLVKASRLYIVPLRDLPNQVVSTCMTKYNSVDTIDLSISNFFVEVLLYSILSFF